MPVKSIILSVTEIRLMQKKKYQISRIKSKMTDGQEVTIEGTAYTAVASGDTISFKAGTGTTYSTEELVGKNYRWS